MITAVSVALFNPPPKKRSRLSHSGALFLRCPAGSKSNSLIPGLIAVAPHAPALASKVDRGWSFVPRTRCRVNHFLKERANNSRSYTLVGRFACPNAVRSNLLLAPASSSQHADQQANAERQAHGVIRMLVDCLVSGLRRRDGPFFQAVISSLCLVDGSLQFCAQVAALVAQIAARLFEQIFTFADSGTEIMQSFFAPIAIAFFFHRFFFLRLH